jgi:hypothetical protein
VDENEAISLSGLDKDRRESLSGFGFQQFAGYGTAREILGRRFLAGTTGYQEKKGEQEARKDRPETTTETEHGSLSEKMRISVPFFG